MNHSEKTIYVIDCSCVLIIYKSKKVNIVLPYVYVSECAFLYRSALNGTRLSLVITAQVYQRKQR